jgi:NAD(P) transhydrogenase subunit alpha
MKIGIPTEIYPDENRVATTPDVAQQLMKLGFEVAIESGAGANASFPDAAYREAGVTIRKTAKSLYEKADIILKVRAPDPQEVLLLEAGTTMISFIWPAQNEDLMKQLADQNVTVLAMDSVPRISRAQKIDALSSMGNISGYRAVIEAAEHFGRFFMGQITAAGKIPPAKVMVIGAGVAGLAAIGTAKGLGAVVRAFDTRPEVKDQIESMNAEFLELEFEEDASGEGGYAKTMSKEFIEAEMALFAEQAREVDIIITTALIPGKPAPKLISSEMVKSMKEGSVIVDLAAEQGGNCELTEKDKVVRKYGVKIIGHTDFPSRLATQASQLYATNIRHLLTEMTPEKEGKITVNMDDEVIRGATVINGGEITWPPPAPKLSAVPTRNPEEPVTSAVSGSEHDLPKPLWKQLMPVGILAIVMLWVGSVAPESFMAHFTVFVLSCFIGYMVIWNVSPSLHTPLMSVTNAISSIIIIGALVQVSAPTGLASLLAIIAIFITSINIFGGFGVTRRMLEMFRK